MLTLDRINYLDTEIQKVLPDILSKILIRLNYENRIDEFLNLLGLQYLLDDTEYKPYKKGKILIVGESEVKENILIKVAKSFGIERDRLEFCLDYNKAAKYNFRKLQYNQNCSAILFGPVPHCGKGKTEFSSIISSIESTPGYPPVYRLGTNTLKITKHDFKDKMEELLSNNIIKS